MVEVVQISPTHRRFGVLAAIEFQRTVLGERQADHDWLSDILSGVEMRWQVPSAVLRRYAGPSPRR